VAWTEQGAITVRNLETGKDTRLTWKDYGPFVVALSADGTLVASGGIKGAKSGVAVWSLADGKHLATLEETEISQALSFCPDGKLLLPSGGGVVLWDWQAGQSRRILNQSATALSCSADGKLVAAAVGSTVRIWDLKSNRLQAECTGAGRQVTRLAFSPDGRRLATLGATSSDLLKLWDTASGREVFSAALPPTKVTAIAFSPDGNRLAAATQAMDITAGITGRKTPGEIHVWDATPTNTKRP